MKTKNNIILAVFIALLLCGCAQVGPYMVSPSVYKSSRNAAVANNQVRTARLNLSKANYDQEQDQVKAWNNLALREIKGGGNGTDGTNMTITAEGVVGGFLCIFKNDSWYGKVLTVQKVGGLLDGQKFVLRMTAHGGNKEFRLFAGEYICHWDTIDYPGQIGCGKFSVTTIPHYYDTETMKNYHGGFRLYGY
jgi:hypothetical protein